MCAGKEPFRCKVDRLIEAMDRQTLALQRPITGPATQIE